jgi:hypothetical protein
MSHVPVQHFPHIRANATLVCTPHSQDQGTYLMMTVSI